MSNSTCPVCGGYMLGDGFKTVVHCEHSDITGKCIEPDSKPVYCGVTYPLTYTDTRGKKQNITSQLEAYVYCPWVLFWDEYWDIAKVQALNGQGIPCFSYSEAVAMTKSDMLVDRATWEAEYHAAILVVAEKYHRRLIERTPKWFIENNPHLVIPGRE